MAPEPLIISHIRPPNNTSGNNDRIISNQTGLAFLNKGPASDRLNSSGFLIDASKSMAETWCFNTPNIPFVLSILNVGGVEIAALYAKSFLSVNTSVIAVYLPECPANSATIL